MFRGSFALSLDDKGRLTLPTRYRDSLLSDAGGQLICTIDHKDPCLMLYPLAEWEEIEEKLESSHSLNSVLQSQLGILETELNDFLSKLN